MTPPRPQTSRLRRNKVSAPTGRYVTPFKAMGISIGIMIALKITAERMAEVAECRRMTSKVLSQGSVAAKRAGNDGEILGQVVGDGKGCQSTTRHE